MPLYFIYDDDRKKAIIEWTTSSCTNFCNFIFQWMTHNVPKVSFHRKNECDYYKKNVYLNEKNAAMKNFTFHTTRHEVEIFFNLLDWSLHQEFLIFCPNYIILLHSRNYEGSGIHLYSYTHLNINIIFLRTAWGTSHV